MLRAEFEKIAEEQGATLTFQESKLNLGNGARSPIVQFWLTLTYKDRLITIHNSTGTHFVGRVKCNIGKAKESLEFEVTTQSHFANVLTKLFSGNKDRFKVKTGNKNIQSFIKNSVAFNKLRAIAKKTLFEPTFLGENISKNYHLTTEYSLQFNDWTQVITPIIAFYKEFIDTFS